MCPAFGLYSMQSWSIFPCSWIHLRHAIQSARSTFCSNVSQHSMTANTPVHFSIENSAERYFVALYIQKDKKKGSLFERRESFFSLYQLQIYNWPMKLFAFSLLMTLKCNIFFPFGEKHGLDPRDGVTGLQLIQFTKKGHLLIDMILSRWSRQYKRDKF